MLVRRSKLQHLERQQLDCTFLVYRLCLCALGSPPLQLLHVRTTCVQAGRLNPACVKDDH